MKFSYPKNEKLKSRKQIQKLFTSGKSIVKNPLRLVFIKAENTENVFQISVTVSKKYFKRAVDRNYIKRVLRETYRLNQSLLKENLTESYAFMVIYQSKNRLSFQEINDKTIELFKQFQIYVSSKSNTKT